AHAACPSRRREGRRGTGRCQALAGGRPVGQGSPGPPRGGRGAGSRAGGLSGRPAEGGTHPALGARPVGRLASFGGPFLCPKKNPALRRGGGTSRAMSGVVAVPWRRWRGAVSSLLVSFDPSDLSS